MDIDNYSPNASVTDMQEKQGWRSLEQMRADATLIMMYKFIQGYVAIPLLHTCSSLSGRPVIGIPNISPRVKFTLLSIIISLRSFLWLLCSGICCQQKFLSCLPLSNLEWQSGVKATMPQMQKKILLLTF